ALRRAREHRAAEREHQPHRERARPPDQRPLRSDRSHDGGPAARAGRARGEARRARAPPGGHLQARAAVRLPGAARGGDLRGAALERARREAEARGVARAAASITTADLGQLDWPVDGKVVYQFGTAAGPNNTRIPWHGIGIAAPQGTPVRAIASGTVSLAGRL